jgi:hypothetical protein
VSCPICRQRKPKRQCPALGRQICSVCCGTKRLTEIACPADCSYLVASKAHPPAVVQRRHQRDVERLLPFLRGLTEPQFALLLLFHSGTAGFRRTAVPQVTDADVVDAAGTLAATLETVERGIIYEHRPTSLPAERLAGEYRRLLAQLEGDRPGRYGRDAAAALRVLERAARESSPPGSPPTAFLELMDRVSARSTEPGTSEPAGGPATEPAAAGGAATGDHPSGPRIILP